jgi:hypothetical protein
MYIAGFLDCLFWDLELLTPLSDRIYLGGDILVRHAQRPTSPSEWVSAAA